MIALTSPYKNIKQHTNISIEPYYMNSDIRNNMKIILKKKVEKKCNMNGFIDEVYRIMSYSDGQLVPENLSGNAIYNIKYHCKICIPVENTMIIGHIKVINQELIVCINGPIMMFIPKDNIDINTWDNLDGYTNKQTKNKLKVGNYIKVHILNKRINKYDTQIKIIGRLVDIATESEVQQFFGSVIDTVENESSFII